MAVGTSSLDRVGQVIERASVDLGYELTDDDYADFEDAMRAKARYVDRNMREERRLADEHGAPRPATHDVLVMLRDQLDEAGAVGVGPMLVRAVVDMLAGLEPDKISSEQRNIERAAVRGGAMTSALNVRFIRGARTIQRVADEDLLEPLVEFPRLLDAWTRLVRQLVERQRRTLRLSWQQLIGQEQIATDDNAGDQLAAERGHSPPPPPGALLRRCPCRRHAPPSRRFLGAAVGTCPTAR